MITDFKTPTDSTQVLPTAAPARHGNSAQRTLGILMVAAAAALAGCGGGGSDSPVAVSPSPAAPVAPPAATPPVATPPAGTPAPVGTTVPTGMATGATLANTGIVYYKDANTNGALDAGERAVVFNPATQHYYELVTNYSTPNVAAGLSWDAALAAAQTRGGHLLIGETTAEIEFVRSTYAYAANTPVPTHGGLQITEADGSLGAWIGLLAVDSPTNIHGSWSWITPASAAGGQALQADAPWLVHATFTNPDGTAATGKLRGAMTGGNDLAPALNPAAALPQCLFDAQLDQPNTATNQLLISRYVVEYETAAAVNTLP